MTLIQPLISIIIPTYNSSKYLKECFESVLQQDYGNLEVIIVDGGSVDETINIVSFYCKKGSNWKFVITDKGVSKQRNKGIDCSTGNYIFFLDSDDYISKSFIKKMYEKMVKNNLDLVTPLLTSVFYDGPDLVLQEQLECKINSLVTKDNFFVYGYDSFLAGPTKLYKKELINSLRHNENLSYGEDLFFNYQLVCNRSINYGLCEDAIYYYRHDVNITNHLERRMTKSNYSFCNLMVDTIRTMKCKNDNYRGAVSILSQNLILFIKAYCSSKKIVPFSLWKSRVFMFFNSKGKIRLFFVVPHLYLFLHKKKKH